MRDAPTKPYREEFVSGMAQRGHELFAATRDAPTKPKGKEFVVGMAQR
jgi:hypothetical protein